MISELPTVQSKSSCIEIRKNTEISFAHYFQPNHPVQFAYSVDWLVLQEKNRAALLLSTKGLYCKPFDINGSNKWESSSLREWLNTEWIQNTFSNGLENLPVPTPSSSPLDVKSLLPYKMPDGGFRKKTDSEDFAFLLSTEEILNLIDSPDMIVEPHWIADRSFLENTHNVKWWARPCNNTDNNIIDENGQAAFSNTAADGIFVRPAVWIDNYYITRCHMEAVSAWRKLISQVKQNAFNYEEFKNAASKAFEILYLHKGGNLPESVREMLILIAKYSEIHFANETPEHQLSLNAAEALCKQSIRWNTIYKRYKMGTGSFKNGFILTGLDGESIVVDTSTFDMLNPLDKDRLASEGCFTF